MRPIPILLYHSVSDNPSSALEDYTLAPARLAEHAETIVGQGWRVLTVSELVTTMRTGGIGEEPTMAITFDDGFADTAEVGAAILSQYGLSATLYVTSGYVGAQCNWLGPDGRRPMASWQQLRDLAAAGWEIGAHSVDHPELDVLARREARMQIQRSRTDLQDGLGLCVDSFAYPHGYHSRSVRDEVIAAGFHNACAVKNGLSSADDDPFALARVTVTSSMTSDDIARLLDDCRHGVGDPVGTGERFRTKAWRCYRRSRHHMRRA